MPFLPRGTRTYAPLRQLLLALPPAQDRVTLTFSAIEAVVGAPLPASAWSPDYWNRRTASTRPTVWTEAGFRARLDRATDTVVFYRADKETSP